MLQIVEKNLTQLENTTPVSAQANRNVVGYEFSSKSQMIERKHIKETNLAGGEADEVILIINKGLFCVRSAWGVHTFMARLLFEKNVLTTSYITETFHAKIAEK